MRIFAQLHDEVCILDGDLQRHGLARLCEVSLRLLVLDDQELWLDNGTFGCLDSLLNPLIRTSEVLARLSFCNGVVPVCGRA